MIFFITSTAMESQHLRGTFGQTDLPSLNTIIAFRYVTPFCKFVKILFFIILSVCLIPLLPFCHDAKILLFSIFTLMAFLILTFGASIISSRRPLPNVVRKIWNIPQWSKSLWINCIYLLNPQYWVNIAYNSRVWVLDWCQFSGFDILGCSHIGRRVIKTGQIGDVYHVEGPCRFQIKDLFEDGDSNHDIYIYNGKVSVKFLLIFPSPCQAGEISYS